MKAAVLLPAPVRKRAQRRLVAGLGLVLALAATVTVRGGPQGAPASGVAATLPGEEAQPRTSESALTIAVELAASDTVASSGPLTHARPSASRNRVTTLTARGEAALAALNYPWQKLGYTVLFRPARAGTLGETSHPARTVTIFVRTGQSELSLRTTIAHELAHVLDGRYGTAERHNRYRQLRQLSASSPWYPCSGCSDLSSPAGDFAEVFATWLAGPGDFRSRLLGPPTAAQLQQLSRLFVIPTDAASSGPHQPAPADPDAPSPTPQPTCQASVTLSGQPVGPCR